MTTEDPTLTLPVGHPQAGYVSPDLSTPTDGLPPEEAEWHEARDEAQQAEAEAVAEHEEKVAKLDADKEDGAEKPAAPAKATAKK